MGAGQREHIGQKIGVIGARSSVDDEQRGSVAKSCVIDQHAMRVDKAFLLGIDG